MWERIKAIIGALVVIGVVAGIFTFAITQTIRSIRRMMVYQPVAAEVVACTKPDPDAQDERLRPGRIEYRFTLNRVTHFNVFPQEQPIAFARVAKPIMHQAKAGDVITAHYDPEDPGQNTLWLGIEPFPLAMAVFAAPFLIVARMAARPMSSGRRVHRHSRPASDGASMLFACYAMVSVVVAFGVGLAADVIGWKAAVTILVVALPGLPLLIFGAALRHARGHVQAVSQPGPSRRRKLDQLDNRPRAWALAGACIFWWFIVGIFVIDGWGAPVRWLLNRGRYIPAPGHVKQSWVAERPGSRRTTFEPIIEYTYTVNGRDYVSRQKDFGQYRVSLDRADAQSQVDAHPPGRQLTVHYDPRRPEQAVLRLDLPGTRWFAAVFLIPFVALGIGLVVHTYRQFRPNSRAQRRGRNA